MRIHIANPKGRTPKVHKKRLPDNIAQTAKNCDLREGTLKALKTLKTDTTFSAPGALRSLYKFDAKWVYWTESDINAVRLQLAASGDRVMYTGDGYPKQFDNTLMAATGKPDGTDDYRRVGITAPTAALTLNLNGSSSGVVKYTVAYVYTYVVKWADGTEEESPPSPSTAATDIDGAEYVSLQNFVIPSLASTGNNITHVRVYRKASSTTGADYRLVKSRGTSATETTDFWYDIPIAKVPNSSTYIYDTNGTATDLWDNSADDLIETTDWARPVDTLAGLVQYQNGILAGFAGRYVYTSEPFVHYAWPTNNRVQVDYDIVALGMYNLSLIVTTTGYPYVVSGADSSDLSSYILPYPQKNLSARGTVSTKYGVVYPCPDGLFLINDEGGTVVTEGVITKTQWEALGTLTTLMGFFYDEKYIGVFAGTGNGFVFNFKENYWIKDFTLNKTVYHGVIDEGYDDLILLTNIGGNDYYADEFERSSSYLTFDWKSKEFETPPVSMSACRIKGSQSTTSPLILIPYGDGTQLQRKHVASSELPTAIASWDFDGDGLDGIASYDATIHGCGWGAGPTGYALDLDGTTADYADTSDPFESLFQASFGIELMFNADDGLPSANEYLFGCSNAGTSHFVLGFLSTNGELYFRLADGVQAVNVITDALFSDGLTGWQHVVCTANTSTSLAYIYVNGVLAKSGSISTITIGNYTQSTYNFLLGAAYVGGSVTSPLDGRIANVKFYDAAVSAAQALALYNNIWFKEVTDEKMFRLPGVGLPESHEYEVLGTTEVESITIATSPEEL